MLLTSMDLQKKKNSSVDWGSLTRKSQQPRPVWINWKMNALLIGLRLKTSWMIFLEQLEAV